MIEFKPHILVNDSGALRFLVHSLDPPSFGALTLKVVKNGEAISVGDPEQFTRPVPDKLRGSLADTVRALKEEVSKLRLTASFASIARMETTLKEPNGLLKSLVDDAKEFEGRLVDELKYMTCLSLQGETEKLYQGNQLFGSAVAEHFPTTGTDIEEAGRCLALGRATACVFHLMRVLEVGLQALARDLGIAKLERNWHQLLQDVEARIRAMPAKTDDEKAKLGLRSAAAAHLRNVKDAWRNDVMHPRDSYTVDQARDVFNHCRALMVSLAGFL